MFGAISSNRESIVVFIAMLKSLRFTFDHEELVGDLKSFLYLREVFVFIVLMQELNLFWEWVWKICTLYIISFAE